SMVNVNKTSNNGKAAGFVLYNLKLNEKKDELALNNKADERNLIKGCSIRNCSLEMKTEKSNIDAGFVYSNDRIIQNCESNLNVESKYKGYLGGYLGGFCGENLKDGTIVGCNFSGSVKAMNLATVGGFVGVNYGKIMHCNARGNVNGGKNVGGFVGRNAKGIISVCKSTGIGIGSIGIVEGDCYIGNIVGGFVGLNEAKIVLSNANSKAIAKTVGAFSTVRAGGFVGENAKGEISDCTAIKGVRVESKTGVFAIFSLKNAKAGGFVGVNKATIANSKATGDVYLSAGILYKDNGCGGFVGQNAKNGNIEGCYAQCKVETTNKKKGGGFVGEAEAKSTIKNSTCKTACVKGYNAD
ncbi:MAG: hypothetical protein K2G97_02240, partial [Oscillospiraceae bacterium]|nr:hypothetical protein [Oscillospiraceae bacterium]